MMGDGLPQAKRPRIPDEDEWPEELLEDESTVMKDQVCYRCCHAANQPRNGRDICGGHLSAGLVKGLISSNVEPVFPHFEAGHRILGVQIASTSGLAQQIVPLFHLARRMSDILVSPYVCKEWLKSNAPDGEISTLRHQTVEFLTFVCSILERLAHSPGDNFPQSPMSLITSIYQQLLSMHSHLRMHLNAVFNGAMTSISLAHDGHDDGLPLVFHLWLDGAWALLSVQATMSKLRLEHYLPQPPSQLLTQHCRAQAIDLLQLQCGAMEKAWPDVQPSDLLACSCIKEAWQTLRLVLDWSSELLGTVSFWSLVNSVLGDFVSSSPPPSGEEAKSPVLELLGHCSLGQRRSFCWLLLEFFNNLYHYDQCGSYVQVTERPGQTIGNWVFVQDLLRMSIDKDASSVTNDHRIHTRLLLTSLAPMADAWPPSQDAVLLLWDIMRCFLNSGMSRDPGLSWSSVNNWVHDCVAVCNGPVDSPLPSSGSQLWWLFLRVLALELKKQQAGISMWVMVKGRFLSRFNRRRMQELGWHGLENFCSLFFVLALCTDTSDIVSKMLPLLDTVPLSDVNCQLVCWRGLLAAHVLCEVQHVAADRVQKSLSNRFSMILTSCLSSGSTEQFAVLTGALDCLEELHNNNFLRGSLHRFLTAEWTALFNGFARHERECCRLLEACVWLVEVVRSSVLVSSEEGSDCHADHSGALCGALWQVIFPSLCHLSSQPLLGAQLSQQVADVCMVFAQLSYVFPGAESDGKTFQSIVQQFGSSEKVPVGIRLRFLSHLISDSDTRHLLLSANASPLAMLFHCWMMAIVSCSSMSVVNPRTRSQLTEFTRALEKLPDIQHILQLREPLEMPDRIDSTSMPKWEASLLTFIRGIGIAYRSASAERRSQYRAQAVSYFAAILPLAEGHLLEEKATPALRCIYRITGCMVQWCSVMLYSRTSHRCLLPQILDKLVVPLSTTKKPVPTAIDSCIRKQVYQFLFGVSCLDFARDDFVRRKLREIVQRNILVPSQSLTSYGGITTSHPYLVALSNLRPVIGDADVKAIRQIALASLRDSFLVFPSKQPNLLHATVSLINCLTQVSSPSSTVADCTTVLARLLSCLLGCEVTAQRTLKPTIEASIKNILMKVEIAGKEERHGVVQLISAYATEHLRQHKHNVFRPLITLLPCCPKLMVEFCPFAEGIVQQFEVSQGKGSDLQLRSVLQQLQKAANVSKEKS